MIVQNMNSTRLLIIVFFRLFKDCPYSIVLFHTIEHIKVSNKNYNITDEPSDLPHTCIELLLANQSELLVQQIKKVINSIKIVGSKEDLQSLTISWINVGNANKKPRTDI